MSTARRRASDRTRATDGRDAVGRATEGRDAEAADTADREATAEPAGREPSAEPGTNERRAGTDRRDAPVDRRAFWRPTPDRRREERASGRRAGDPPTR